MREGVEGGLMVQAIDHVADGVWLVTGTDVNWVLVADGDEVTLVDTGEPRDLPRVLSSLEWIGRALGRAGPFPAAQHMGNEKRSG
jgi:glyoxylase-like metal-dependent hydrolase (beta-lactamase superfamily II)